MKMCIATADLLLSLPTLAQEDPIDGAVSTLAMTDYYLHRQQHLG
ncbi:hypothetical protein EIO60_02612|nr:hypothetical protein [Candidatus Pantoea persica]